MEILYKRKHNESFMEVKAEDVHTSFEQRMIEENNINALLDFTTVNLNGDKRFCYNISRKENLEDFLDSHDMSLEIIRRLILNIQIAYEEVSKYLIDECHIWLSMETIFLEKIGGSFKVSLCYYPKDMGDVQEQFRGLMEQMLKYAPSGDREGAKKIYEAYDLCLKDDYTLGEILDCLEDFTENQEIEIQQIHLREEQTTESFLEREYYESTEEFMGDYLEDDTEKKEGIFNQFLGKFKGVLTKKIEFKDEFSGESEDFIVEPDFEFEEKTVLLSETRPAGKLVYDGQNQEDDFLVTKDVFRIGKSKSCDAVLHAATVSANHAKIVKEGDDYFITDLNSTNSTFVNNEELVYKKAVKLHIFDKIRFANVCYTFM